MRTGTRRIFITIYRYKYAHYQFVTSKTNFKITLNPSITGNWQDVLLNNCKS